MDEDAIEKVARAHHELIRRNLVSQVIPPWEEITEEAREIYRQEAIIAIEAHKAALREAGFVILRQESEGVLDAAREWRLARREFLDNPGIDPYRTNLATHELIFSLSKLAAAPNQPDPC